MQHSFRIPIFQMPNRSKGNGVLTGIFGPLTGNRWSAYLTALAADTLAGYFA
jgi:hypothetical protein